MVDLHLVLPALNLSNPDAGILIMVHQVRLMMFSLNMVDYWGGMRDYPHDFSVRFSPSPLGTNFGFELGWTGLGLCLEGLIRLWGQGLTISIIIC